MFALRIRTRKIHTERLSSLGGTAGPFYIPLFFFFALFSLSSPRSSNGTGYSQKRASVCFKIARTLAFQHPEIVQLREIPGLVVFPKEI